MSRVLAVALFFLMFPSCADPHPTSWPPNSVFFEVVALRGDVSRAREAGLECRREPWERE